MTCLICMAHSQGGGADLTVSTKTRDVIFSQDTGDLMEICTRYGAAHGRKRFASEDKKTPLVSLTLLQDPAGDTIEDLHYSLVKREEGDTRVLLWFASHPLPSGAVIEKHYTFSTHDYFITMAVVIRDAAIGSAASFPSMAVTFQPDMGDPVIFRSGESGTPGSPHMVFLMDKDYIPPSQFVEKDLKALAPGNFAGVHDRFYTLLIGAVDTPLPMSTLTSAKDQPQDLRFTVSPDRGRVALKIYAGPISTTEFHDEKAMLSPLLYYHLWFWVRYISFGLSFLLSGLIKMTGCHGLAIILLSLVVKVLMLPLVRLSDRWQREVNENKSLLHPHLTAIKKQYKGEEQHRRILAVHKELGIHPMYPLKTFLGCFIQIPIFFAAYHTLGENVSLSGVSFLWIKDLAEPDHFLTLPIHLIYFGNHLNLLPLLMTIITVVTAYLFKDASLSDTLVKKQKLNLYVMAGFFFVLFYTFPAGMVLYWTVNNVFALFKTITVHYLPLAYPKETV